MKKILLCLCFVFAVGLLFSACGKDDTTAGIPVINGAPPTVESPMTPKTVTIGGHNVTLELYPQPETADDMNIDWELNADNSITIKIGSRYTENPFFRFLTIKLTVDGAEHTLSYEPGTDINNVIFPLVADPSLTGYEGKVQYQSYLYEGNLYKVETISVDKLDGEPIDDLKIILVVKYANWL